MNLDVMDKQSVFRTDKQKKLIRFFQIQEDGHGLIQDLGISYIYLKI